MTGLKTYARDRELPAIAGEPELVPPSGAELAELARERLAGAPTAAELVYARWKPRASITATYRVELDDGGATHVTYKRWAGDKARSIERSWTPREPRSSADGSTGPSHGLVLFAVDADAGWCLYALPADRALPGLARAFDLKRGARSLASSFAGRLRWRRSSATLLRYKPEHRAVLRLDLVSRDANEELAHARVALRALPADEARRVAAARAHALPSEDGGRDAALAPRILATELDAGLLFEEWIDVATFAGDAFGHAEDAGKALARLHRSTNGLEVAATRARSDHRELFAFDAGLARLNASLPAPPALRTECWIHGDFHPDQVARRDADGAFALLDLDAVRPGAPVEDLAAWIADAEAAGFRDGARALLEGHRAAGGATPSARELAPWIAQELRERAAATLRRLEAGAPERARSLLGRAKEVLA